MHIVQVAPPWFPVPPVAYGGIERVVYDLTEGLVAAGHEVSLLAPAGSVTSARLVMTSPHAMTLDLAVSEKAKLFDHARRETMKMAAEIDADLVHDHTDAPVPADFPHPIVRTIHGPAAHEYAAIYREMSQEGAAFIAISRRQRELFDRTSGDGPSRHGRQIRFAAVIHNPIDVRGTPFYPQTAKEGYAAFLGRCHWEKDPAAAIRIAKAAGVPLKMALRVTCEERPYFDAVVKPLIEANRGLVEFLGEVGGQERAELLGRASVVIFPSPWEEPFGLVLIEAAAHGTPVVALHRGAAPEIVVDGVTGHLCHDEEEMAQKLVPAMRLDPLACRMRAATTFDRSCTARRHLAVYERLAAQRRATMWQSAGSPSPSWHS